MFGISGFKWLIILIAGLILVGPEKLPEIGRTVGKAIAMFRRAQADMSAIMRAEMADLDKMDKDVKEKRKTLAEATREKEEESAEEAGTAETVASGLYDETPGDADPSDGRSMASSEEYAEQASLVDCNTAQVVEPSV